MMTVWLVAGALIIFVLAVIAIYYQVRVFQQGRKQREWQLELEGKEQVAQSEARKSIAFICRAFLAEQVECAEASIRISHLADRLDLDDVERAPYLVFDKVRAALDHIPIKDAWRNLDKKTKRGHRRIIEKTEKDYHAFALEAARQVLDSDIVLK